MRISVLAVIVLSLCALPATVLAQEKFPDLIGVWTAEKTIYFLDGKREGTLDILTIASQDGPHFSGTLGWRHPQDKEPLGNVGGQATHQAVEPILGILDFDNESIVIVDHGDLGRMSGRLVDADTMQLIYSEVGDHAAIYRAVLKRRPE